MMFLWCSFMLCASRSAFHSLSHSLSLSLSLSLSFSAALERCFAVHHTKTIGSIWAFFTYFPLDWPHLATRSLSFTLCPCSPLTPCFTGFTLLCQFVILLNSQILRSLIAAHQCTPNIFVSQLCVCVWGADARRTNVLIFHLWQSMCTSTSMPSTGKIGK